jgi:hypothetical protein
MGKVHLFTFKKKKSGIGLFFKLLLAGVVVAAFFMGFSSVPETAEAESLAMANRAIHSALVTCYAVEGRYPQFISYLEENYGLYIDRNKYFVTYEADAWNMMPNYNVIQIPR